MNRVCITEVIKRIGNKGWLDKRKEKLPRTTKILEQKLESFEEFMLRKIEVFTKTYIEERAIPTELRFRIRAVLRNSTAVNSEEINLAVRNAITAIKNSFVVITTE